MTSKHTPGLARAPWTAFELGGKPHKLLGRGWGVNAAETDQDDAALPVRVADCYGQRAADHARLIAAAPAMLAALERFAQAIERGRYPELQGVATDAFAAIAQAKGE